MRLESIAEALNAMNNIGYVFSGIRHEIGNPINSTKMVLGVLKEKLSLYPESNMGEYLERASGELNRVQYLLNGLKSFNMFEKPAPQVVGVGEFLRNLLNLVKSDFSRKGISVEISSDPEDLTCRADPRALQQALLNILTNAGDACGERENAKVSIAASRSLGMALVRVADNGCGIDEEQQKQLFKPFYTTKPNGTGLGLVIARKMLVLMNGTIAVRSWENEGTVVDIHVPESV